MGCGTLVCLSIIGVALFFAMYFGNLFSIPGVIVLLIIGVVVFIQLLQMLSKSQQEVTKQRADKEHYQRQVKDYEQKEQERQREKEQERQREKKQQEKRRQEQEKQWCSIM
jgi:predicted lipid-binding transport protein (Tim44 family)